jgi:hypothetical protein
MQGLKEIQERQATQIGHHTEYIRALELRIQELESSPVQREGLNDIQDADQRPTAPFPVPQTLPRATSTAPLPTVPNLSPELPTLPLFPALPPKESKQSVETDLRKRPGRVTATGWFLVFYGNIAFLTLLYAIAFSPSSRNWLHNTPSQEWFFLFSQLVLFILGIGLLKLWRWALVLLTFDILFSIGMDIWLLFPKLKPLPSLTTWITNKLLLTSAIEGIISSLLFFIVLFSLLLSRKVWQALN